VTSNRETQGKMGLSPFVRLCPFVRRPTLRVGARLRSVPANGDCPLFPAAALFGADASGEIATKLELARIQSNADWIAPIVVLVLILVIIRGMYRRDSAELPRWLGWLLTVLRAAAFGGLLLLYLQPQWRCERQIIHPSRVALLVDTSMSMNRVDAENQANKNVSRLQQVASGLDGSDFLFRLRKTHDVAVYQFNNSLERDRLVLLNKAVELETGDAGRGAGDNLAPGEHTGGTAEQKVPWQVRLQPRGSETRLGDAMEELLRDLRDSPLAGLVLLSDGGQNAGISPDAAVETAREARVPVFAVGVGSERKPVSVRVYDFKAPARAYPGDRYTANGFIQAQGLSGRTLTVNLLVREGPSAKDATQRGKGQIAQTRSVLLGGDGQVVPVRFDIMPDKTGRRTLCLRVEPPPGDTNPRDKFLEAEVEVVERKNHVLLLAGGPTRDYQFLRALLHRDRATELDILLQSAQPGISQEANKILDAFPAQRDEMYSYDCVVALDPNWQTLRPAQIELLENWVGDQGGGLIAVAGAVYAGRAAESWAQDPEMAKIRNLYPVEFHRYLSSRAGVAYAAKEPWPLEFTREGLEAEYLWLADTAAASQAAWASFPGVYGFCPLRGVKPGATVLARFSDPRVAQAGQQPVYFAEQFYGSGRVFYMGSGEIWRLRSVEPAYFEQCYTKLIRHVSQGRLLRQSQRGVLLVGQEHYLVGSTVEVRAQLTNSRLEPLNVPQVVLHVSHNGTVQKTVVLQADPSRVGTYLGQFPVLSEGEYHLELPVPESREERLTRTVRVVIPKLEEENPQLNAALLRDIAAKTGGIYYSSVSSALAESGPQSLAERLKDCTRTELLPVAPNPRWEEQWMRWLMIALCGVLCLEWTIRRLLKLA
jgi:hypothetical protein